MGEIEREKRAGETVEWREREKGELV